MKKLSLFFIGVLLVWSGYVHAQNVDPGPNVGDRGSITMTYRGQTVTYKTVRAEDGNIWMQQDLGSAKVADSIKDFSARGDFFQWGRWDDGGQALNPAAAPNGAIPNPNNPSGITGGSPNFFVRTDGTDWWAGGNNNDTWSSNPPSATNGLDPCAAIGKGWHLPTKEEWETVLDSAAVITSFDAYDTELKLISAGSRFTTNGNYTTSPATNPTIQYWTNTPSNASAWFVNIDIVGSFGLFSDALGRGYGRPCRCMKLKVDCTTITDSSAINMCSQDLESGYTLPGGEVVQQAGVYVDSFKTEDDCDSIIVTILTEEKINTDVENTGHSLMAYETGATYQWLDCDLDYAEVENAGQQSFTPSVAGNFAVAITKNGCTDTSSCYPVEPVKIDGINIKSDIKIYPNPVGSSIHIISPVPVNASLLSVDGKVILNSKNATIIPIGNLNPGLYFLRLESTDNILLKTEKIIKSK